MKKNILFSLIVLIAIPALAQSNMKELWASMPDSLIPYLSKSNRIEMADLKGMNVKAEVKNAYDDNCILDTITSDFMSVTLSESSYLQMGLLPYNGSQIICMVYGFKSPLPECELRFYSSEWRMLDMYVGGKSCRFLDDAEHISTSLLCKPDSMSEDRYKEIKAMIEPMMVEIKISPNEKSVIFDMKSPILKKDDSDAIKSIIRQIKFKWNGIIFKKC